MKKFNFFSIVLMLCFSFNLYSQSEAELRQKIEAINKEMTKSVISGDFMAGIKYYAEDAISMPNNTPMMEGIAAIRQSNESMAQMGIKFKSFDTQIRQIKTCGNQVIEVGTYKMTMSIPGMPNDYEDHGKYMTIWEKQKDGSLKIKYEMWNTDVSPAGAGTSM